MTINPKHGNNRKGNRREDAHMKFILLQQGVKEKVLLVATTHNLQFGGYEMATPFHERAVQPLVTRPTSPQVVSVAGIMQLLHCARQLSRKTVSAWMAWVSKGQGGAKEGFPCRFTTEISPHVSFLVLIHSMLDAITIESQR